MKRLINWLKHNFGKVNTNTKPSRAVIYRSLKERKKFDKFYDKKNLNPWANNNLPYPSGYCITGACSGYFNYPSSSYVLTGMYVVDK